jgi:hypothetical protein
MLTSAGGAAEQQVLLAVGLHRLHTASFVRKDRVPGVKKGKWSSVDTRVTVERFVLKLLVYEACVLKLLYLRVDTRVTVERFVLKLLVYEACVLKLLSLRVDTRVTVERCVLKLLSLSAERCVLKLSSLSGERCVLKCSWVDTRVTV